MFQPCKYKNYTKCKSCTAVYYKECKTFQKAHIAFLTRNIRPFHFVHQHFSEHVVWSRDEDKAKSAALQYASSLNQEIKVLSMSQVISLTVSNEEVEGKVFYIDYKAKLSGDSEKVLGVLQSFVDKILFQGGCISIYVGATVSQGPKDYKRL